MILPISGILRKVRRNKKMDGLFLPDDSESKPAKLLGVVENERELRREHDRSFHRHVAICRFVQFLTGHPELAFNRAQDSPRKIPEGADGN